MTQGGERVVTVGAFELDKMDDMTKASSKFKRQNASGGRRIVKDKRMYILLASTDLLVFVRLDLY